MADDGSTGWAQTGQPALAWRRQTIAAHTMRHVTAALTTPIARVATIGQAWTRVRICGAMPWPASHPGP